MKLPNVTCSPARRFPFGKLTSAKPAAYGLALDANLSADGALGVAESI